MIRIKLFFLLACIAVISIAARARADEQPKPVKARMIADVSAVVPGEPFEIAVLLELDPHWHVYWKNPGDSGLPTSVVFSLPEGFTASGLNWPVPGILKGAGGVTDYGYEGSLLLSSLITTPHGIKSGTTIKITAKVSWVSCSDICIPGRTELSLDLPVSATNEHMNQGLFAEWRARLPVNLRGGAPPFKTDLKTVSKGENEYSASISIEPTEELKDIALYPVPGNSYMVENIEVGDEGDDGGSKVSFDVKVIRAGESLDKPLETLIIYTDKDGKKSGYELQIPLNK